MKPKIVVVDDHELVLQGTESALKKQYPEAELLIAQTPQDAQKLVEEYSPDLVILDLCIPKSFGSSPHVEIGLQFLRVLMDHYPTLNIAVQSANTKSLIRLKPQIDAHEGGFTVIDKSCSRQEMLTKISLSLQGFVHTPKELRAGLEIKPEWLEVMRLAFEEGLQDKAIAKRMNLSERTVRHYWTKILDVLDIHPEEDYNLRVLVKIRAREEGLID